MVLAKLRVKPKLMRGPVSPTKDCAVSERACATDAEASTTGCVASNSWLSSCSRLMLPVRVASSLVMCPLACTCTRHCQATSSEATGLLKQAYTIGQTVEHLQTIQT